MPIEWIGIGLIAVGQIYTWVRNGAQARKAIDKRLNETETKLLAEISSIKITCAGARASFTTRLDNHDNDFKRIEEKR